MLLSQVSLSEHKQSDFLHFVTQVNVPKPFSNLSIANRVFALRLFWHNGKCFPNDSMTNANAPKTCQNAFVTARYGLMSSFFFFFSLSLSLSLSMSLHSLKGFVPVATPSGLPPREQLNSWCPRHLSLRSSTYEVTSASSRLTRPGLQREPV